MSEPIDELKRRQIKKDVLRAEPILDDADRSIGGFKGRKIEHIDPKTSKTRDLFKKNIQTP